MKYSLKTYLAVGAVAIVMVGLGILLALAQQRRDLKKRTETKVTANTGVLDCDPGTDPYNSNTIVVTNNSNQTISNISSDVFRCPYVPGIVEKYRGSFKCEPTCNANEPNCLEGVWDESLNKRNVTLEPGESKTFSVTANACEIVQIDVRNDDVNNGALECHNVQSQNTVPHGEVWPGGIAFGISENPDGYPNCETPTPTPFIPTSTPVPTVAKPNTPVPPTIIPTQPPKGGPLPTNTPYPTIPVSGSTQSTMIGVAGGLILLILSLLAL